MVPSDPPPPPTGPRNPTSPWTRFVDSAPHTTMRRVAGNPPPPFVTLPLRAAPRDAEGPTRAGPSSGAEASTKSGAEASTSGRADTTITLVSWNIGLRGLRQLADASRTADRVASKDEHGVSRQLGYGSVAALLASLGEDVHVVCLQETKLTGRGDLTQALACPPGWDSAFSVCRDANGKRGEVRLRGGGDVLPRESKRRGREEGITGVLAEDDERYDDAPNDERERERNETKTKTKTKTRTRRTPRPPSAAAAPMGERFSRPRMRELDAEGRCVLVDFGGFVLFNLYVPAITSSDEREAEARAEFKRDFLDAAAIRWSAPRAAGATWSSAGTGTSRRWRSTPRTRPRGAAPRKTPRSSRVTPGGCGSRARSAERRGGCLRRRSARDERRLFVGTGSSGTGAVPARLVDAFRAAYPGVTGAYTCWNVAAGAQLTNHGSRIDYFLVDPDFARSVTRCGIARSHPGSDHCPVFIAVAAPTDVFRNAEDVETRARRVLPALVSSVALARAGRQARLTGFFRKALRRRRRRRIRARRASPSARSGEATSRYVRFSRGNARLLGKTTRATARGTPVWGGENAPPPRWRRRRKRRRGLLPRAPPAERLSGSIRRKRRRGLLPRAAPPLP